MGGGKRMADDVHQGEEVEVGAALSATAAEQSELWGQEDKTRESSVQSPEFRPRVDGQQSGVKSRLLAVEVRKEAIACTR